MSSKLGYGTRPDRALRARIAVMIHALMLVGGLMMLIVGAMLLVNGASGLARSLHVSELLIGLTIVAFGTSAPELAVNLSAALTGNGDMAFGNVVGSNICNIGLILGLSALIRALQIKRSIILREIPIMVLASLVMAALMFDEQITSATQSILTRGDGIVLLLGFSAFLYIMVGDALATRAASTDDERPHAVRPWPVALLMAAIGLGGLVGGGHLTIVGASALATTLGIPQVVVGLLVVAVGTSLPELATSIVAAVRGQHDMAVGNVVGSNIFNLLFILGVSSTISPVTLPAGGHMDLLAMLLLAIGLLPIALSHDHKLVRWEGGLLLAAYIAFVLWRAF